MEREPLRTITATAPIFFIGIIVAILIYNGSFFDNLFSGSNKTKYFFDIFASIGTISIAFAALFNAIFFAAWDCWGGYYKLGLHKLFYKNKKKYKVFANIDFDFFQHNQDQRLIDFLRRRSAAYLVRIQILYALLFSIIILFVIGIINSPLVISAVKDLTWEWLIIAIFISIIVILLYSLRKLNREICSFQKKLFKYKHKENNLECSKIMKEIEKYEC